MGTTGFNEKQQWLTFLINRDDRTREGLIEHYKPLVEQVLRRFRNVRPADREDLRGAGYYGLIKAVDSWDPARMPWERFAKHTIFYAMINQIREVDWVPKGIRAQAQQLDEIEEALTGELGRQPTDVEIAERMEMSPDELGELMASFRATDWNIASLDFRRETENPWTEAVPDTSSLGEDPERIAFRNEDLDRLELILQRLTGRERFVIRWRFFSYPRLSQTEIAAKLGVHESRVSQIVDAAIKRARELKEMPLVMFADEVYGVGQRMTVRE